MQRSCWLGLVVIAGCRFDPAGGVDAGAGASDAPPGPPPGTEVFVLDSAAELAGATTNPAELTAAFVSGAPAQPFPIPGPGTVEPAAYRYGGLVGYGVDDRRVFTDATMATWEQLVGADVDGVGLLTPTGGAFVDASFAYPAGIRASDQFTVFFEGELYLPAGTYTFQLAADDDGFVELAAPGSTVFARLLEVASGVETAPFTAPNAGWHPVRAAMSQAGGQTRFDLLLQRTGQVSPTRIPAAWLRAPVHHLAGVAVEAWQGLLGGPRSDGVAIDGTSPLDQRWGLADPLDVDAAGAALTWRWSSQVRTEPGRVELTVDASHGHRVWIDGAMRSLPAAWGAPVGGAGLQISPIGPTQTLVAIESSAPGWHDLVVEAYGARAEAPSLRVTGAPDVTTLRPASAAVRTLALDRGTRLALISPEVGAQTMTVPSPVGGGAPLRVVAVDVVTTVVATAWAQTTIRIVPPGSPPIVLRPAAARLPGSYTDAFHVPASALPADLDPRGDWKVEVDTGPGGNAVTYDAAALTLHLTGGTPAIAPIATYVSPVIDLGRALRLTNVFADGPPTAAGEITMRARACADALATSCGAWRSAAELAQLDERGPYAQAQITFTSDGVRAPIVDRITVWGFP